ncbi:hypothetical protein NDU88_006780 [Pleurodeles waltl]|uniref:Uncharacterized protein n=1 Tax=Pleurodeles waltl TaxID=8319 RepID=A0AAV7WEY9_PLEWA|nr:hypothetical protein NDU88_006780 [Pleurodeles waltl]
MFSGRSCGSLSRLYLHGCEMSVDWGRGHGAEHGARLTAQLRRGDINRSLDALERAVLHLKKCATASACGRGCGGAVSTPVLTPGGLSAARGWREPAALLVIGARTHQTGRFPILRLRRRVAGADGTTWARPRCQPPADSGGPALTGTHEPAAGLRLRSWVRPRAAPGAGRGRKTTLTKRYKPEQPGKAPTGDGPASLSGGGA